MPRTYNFNQSVKAQVAGSPTTFTQADIPGPGVVEYYAEINGGTDAATSGNWFGAGGVEIVRVKANGTTIVDINYKQLRVFLGRFTPANYAPLTLGTTTNARRITIPLNFGDQEDSALADAQGFPLAAGVQVEFFTSSAATSVGNIRMGWATSDIVPSYYPNILGNALGWAASVNGQRFNLSQAGFVRGIVVPGEGFSQLRIVIAGREILSLSSALNSFADPSKYGLLQQSQQTDNMTFIDGDHVALKFDVVSEVPSGASYLQADTDAAFATTTFENTFALYTAIPQAAA